MMHAKFDLPDRITFVVAAGVVVLVLVGVGFLLGAWLG